MIFVTTMLDQHGLPAEGARLGDRVVDRLLRRQRRDLHASRPAVTSRCADPHGTFIDGNNEIGLALAMTVPFLFSPQPSRTEKIPSRRHARFRIVDRLRRSGNAIARRLAGDRRDEPCSSWLKSRSKILTGILIVVFAAITLPMLPEEWYARACRRFETYEQDASALGRLNAWGMAFNMALHRLTGGGFESFQQYTFWLYAPDPTNVRDSHSIYFQVMGHHRIHRLRDVPPAS